MSCGLENKEDKERDWRETILVNAYQTIEEYLLCRAEIYSNKNKQKLSRRSALRRSRPNPPDNDGPVVLLSSGSESEGMDRETVAVRNSEQEAMEGASSGRVFSPVSPPSSPEPAHTSPTDHSAFLRGSPLLSILAFTAPCRRAVNGSSANANPNALSAMETDTESEQSAPTVPAPVPLGVPLPHDEANHSALNTTETGTGIGQYAPRAPSSLPMDIAHSPVPMDVHHSPDRTNGLSDIESDTETREYAPLAPIPMPLDLSQDRQVLPSAIPLNSIYRPSLPTPFVPTHSDGANLRFSPIIFDSNLNPPRQDLFAAAIQDTTPNGLAQCSALTPGHLNEPRFPHQNTEQILNINQNEPTRAMLDDSGQNDEQLPQIMQQPRQMNSLKISNSRFKRVLPTHDIRRGPMNEFRTSRTREIDGDRSAAPTTSIYTPTRTSPNNTNIKHFAPTLITHLTNTQPSNPTLLTHNDTENHTSNAAVRQHSQRHHLIEPSDQEDLRNNTPLNSYMDNFPREQSSSDSSPCRSPLGTTHHDNINSILKMNLNTRLGPTSSFRRHNKIEQPSPTDIKANILPSRPFPLQNNIEHTHRKQREQSSASTLSRRHTDIGRNKSQSRTQNNPTSFMQHTDKEHGTSFTRRSSDSDMEHSASPSRVLRPGIFSKFPLTTHNEQTRPAEHHTGTRQQQFGGHSQVNQEPQTPVRDANFTPAPAAVSYPPNLYPGHSGAAQMPSRPSNAKIAPGKLSRFSPTTHTEQTNTAGNNITGLNPMNQHIPRNFNNDRSESRMAPGQLPLFPPTTATHAEQIRPAEHNLTEKLSRFLPTTHTEPANPAEHNITGTRQQQFWGHSQVNQELKTSAVATNFTSDRVANYQPNLYSPAIRPPGAGEVPRQPCDVLIAAPDQFSYLKAGQANTQPAAAHLQNHGPTTHYEQPRPAEHNFTGTRQPQFWVLPQGNQESQPPAGVAPAGGNFTSTPGVTPNPFPRPSGAVEMPGQLSNVIYLQTVMMPPTPSQSQVPPPNPPAPKPPPIMCPHCGRTFKNPSGFKGHQKRGCPTRIIYPPGY